MVSEEWSGFKPQCLDIENRVVIDLSELFVLPGGIMFLTINSILFYRILSSDGFLGEKLATSAGSARYYIGVLSYRILIFGKNRMLNFLIIM